MLEYERTAILVESDELIELSNTAVSPERADYIRQFPVAGAVDAPLRISAEMRCEGVTGTPGVQCSAFFNIEYDQGPIFWDTFLYPDTGSTPWRKLSCEVRARGTIRSIEMHIRFQSKGCLRLRNLRVETMEPSADDADAVVAVFGDSTDMTCYLPTEHRMARRLELLLRDRFADHRIDVHCLAEGGEDLPRLIDSGKLDRELRMLPRCDVAMIRYGLNDKSKGVEPQSFGHRLHDACDRILQRFPMARIVLSTTIPDGALDFDKQTVEVAGMRGLHLIPLCAHIRGRSAACDWDWHLEPSSRIGRRRTGNPADNPTGLAGDIHPNTYGAQMIAEFYFEHLEPIVEDVILCKS